MKYFNEEITVMVNGTTACAIYERESKEAALSAHHSAMASAIINEDVASIHSEAKNSIGGVYENETYIRAIEPDPEHPDVP